FGAAARRGRGALALAASRTQGALNDLIISIRPEAIVVAGRREHVIEQVVGKLGPEKLAARGNLSAGVWRGVRGVHIGGLRPGARGRRAGRGGVRRNTMRTPVMPVAMRQHVADGAENRRKHSREG